MRADEINFFLALADLVLLGYVHLRRRRRLPVERMLRSLRCALQQQAGETQPGALVLERAS